MAMVQRPVDAYKQEREMRRRTYTNTSSLREKFPQVEQLVLELSFTDPTGVGKHSPQVHTLGPAARAYFEVPCPCSACLSGGFDLSGVISDMLARRGRIAAGKSNCGGWQDRGRIGEHRCQLQLSYRATASYQPVVGASGRARLDRAARLAARR